MERIDADVEPITASSTSRRGCSQGCSLGGYSLVEVVISMFVLSLFILAFTQSLLFTKYLAEDNLYTATAMTVAISAIEQMKSVSLNRLANPQSASGNPFFEMTVKGNETVRLFLNRENTIDVPIITEQGGNTAKTMPINITPSINPMTDLPGFWLEIEYSYAHPRTGRVRTEVVRNVRSDVRR